MLMLKRKGLALLSLGALGIVFGDIGTSPLYALQAAFSVSGHNIERSASNVYGIISLLIYAILLVVSVKYLSLIMKANNNGEGGIMALVALVRKNILDKKIQFALILFGTIGVCLFYGDGVITPAISVLSAVEGLKVISPELNNLIIPITLFLIAVLFLLQKYGTATVGYLFGPVMLLWFITIGGGGLYQIIQHPSSLVALSPLTAVDFIYNSPLTAFLTLSAVVLAITGVEALYADLGHFGREPIKRSWYYIVFPSLILCYIGQGALLLNNTGNISNLLLRLFPSYLQLPILLLATLATIIASQAVISGLFSLTKQAVQLDFLPKINIIHTSNSESGQIYIPVVNILLYVAVSSLVLIFGSSTHLALAYGIAVSGTITIDLILFSYLVKYIFRDKLAILTLCTCVLLPLDILFILSNLQKILHGAIYPLVFAIIALILIKTWTKGEQIVADDRFSSEESISKFMSSLKSSNQSIIRSSGSAIYITQHRDKIPTALVDNTKQFKDIPEHLVILHVETSNSSHVLPSKRAKIDEMKLRDGIVKVELTYGYKDNINIPKALKSLKMKSRELNFDLDKAIYYISKDKVIRSRKSTMSGWRKTIYLLMSKNELSDPDFYKLPVDRTNEFTTLISL